MLCYFHLIGGVISSIELKKSMRSNGTQAAKKLHTHIMRQEIFADTLARLFISLAL